MRIFILTAAMAFATLTAPSSALAGALDQMCDPAAGMPAGRQGPEGINTPSPAYPAMAQKDWSEGWATFDFTIAPDGTTRDIALRDYLGPTSFAEISGSQLRNWRYRPATMGGMPVETYGYGAEVTFLFEETGAGERKTHSSEFEKRYDQARNLIKTDPAAAVRALDTAFHDRLGLYEEAMGSYLMALALVAADAKSWHQSLVHIRHAVINGGAFLDPAAKPGAMDLDVFFEAQNGNYKEAYCVYRQQRAAGTGLSVQTQQLGEKFAALLTAPEPLVIPAEVFADMRPGISAAWVHPMLRHKFSFSGVKGVLKNFHLQCTATTLDSPINEETQWAVPPNAGHCTLFVYGENGASFQLIEEE